MERNFILHTSPGRVAVLSFEEGDISLIRKFYEMSQNRRVQNLHIDLEYRTMWHVKTTPEILAQIFPDFTPFSLFLEIAEFDSYYSRMKELIPQREDGSGLYRGDYGVSPRVVISLVVNSTCFTYKPRVFMSDRYEKDYSNNKSSGYKDNGIYIRQYPCTSLIRSLIGEYNPTEELQNSEVWNYV